MSEEKTNAETKEDKKTVTETFRANSEDLIKKVKEIIKEGNARRIMIKDDKDQTVLEIPVTLGVVGALFAPYLAALGAVAAIVTNCSIVVEKRDPEKPVVDKK